ncbi:MAG: hypothetical protein NWR03_05525 [Akkermansiaceae bacterium]|jgi:uncharacterized iron-regulated membrane protein|nr:hypothetical protein [Akkermansiaceae bacterium]
MSDREKKLLALLLFAGFFIANLFFFKFYNEKKLTYANDLTAAKASLQQAIMFSESSASITDEMEWLATNEPAPSAYQPVQSGLQKFAVTQAQNLGLTVKSQELLPTDDTGAYYHRAQFRINLTGREETLYKWFNEVNDPAAFRSAYQIRLSPNSTDDTLIDCSATLAQWFPPAI